MAITASKLRADVYRILDEVLRTGQPVEIERKGRKLKVVAVDPPDRLAGLTGHPGMIVGDPDDLIHMDWSSEWKPFD